MFEHLGARTLFVVLLPLQIFGLLGTVFFLPESQFRRGEDGDGAREDSMAPTERVVTASEEGGEKRGAETRETTASSSPGSPHARIAIPKRTFLQDLRPFTGITYTHTPVLQLLGEIFIHLLNPAVLWVQLVSAVLVSFFVGTAYTLAQIFTPPPYSLSVSQNGFFFTGALIGGLLSLSAGSICDFTAKHLARRNKGGTYHDFPTVNFCHETQITEVLIAEYC
jgi:hypothetical protein